MRTRIPDKAVSFLEKVTEISIFATIFFIPISISLTNIGIVCAIFMWATRKVLSGKLALVKTPVNWLLLAFMGVAIISCLNSILMPSSIRGLLKPVKYFVFFFVITETINNVPKLKRLAVSAVAGFLLVSIDGLAQYVMGKDFLRGYPLPYWGGHIFSFDLPRIQASMHNPNSFACYLVAVIPLVITLFFYYPRKRINYFLLITVLLGLFNLFNTFSRGAGLGLVAALVTFSIAKRDWKPLAVLSSMVLLFLIAAPKPVLDWIYSNLNLYDFFIEEGGRRLHWQAAVNMIKAHPFIGVGVNTFSINYAQYKSAADTFTGWYAHNSYLQLAAETGLAGLTIFFSIVIVVVAGWWRTYIRIQDKALAAISLGVFGGFVGFLVNAAFESSLQISNLAVLFWFIASVLVSITIQAANSTGS